MIPILFAENQTTFTSNGLGRLADVISCNVKEERNGIFELQMTYPITGVHYADLKETRIILARTCDGGTPQPFIIYKITRPADGVVTVNAEHISYRLSTMVAMPFMASNAAQAVSRLSANIVGTNPFTFTTDIVKTADYKVELPSAARGLMGGQQGSLLQAYGGEWEFNGFDCNLKASRGSDNHVTIRYGKNISDIKADVDMTSVYTGIVPYWTDGTELVTLTEKVVMSSHASDYPFNIIKPVDFSNEFEEKPTETQLRNKASSYVESNEGWKLSHNIDVSFVALWQTEQYKNIAPVERVKLCDTVTVIYEPLGVNFQTKVIATDYDVLMDRYNSITLGKQTYQLGSIITEAITESETRTDSRLEKSIDRATKLIQGGLGGHVVFSTNADGEPEEILIMDTDDKQTATNVIRMNLAGIGFSKNGYNGPFSTAWTIDGHFNASFIDAGTLDASKITVQHLSASSIDTGTLNASVVSVTNLNASNITTGSFTASGSAGSFNLNANTGSLTWSLAKTSLDANGVFSSFDGVNTAKLKNGELVFAESGTDIAIFQPTYWTASPTNKGAAVQTSSSATFVAFGHEISEDTYNTTFVVNYGLNPLGRSEDVDVFGSLYVSGGIHGSIYASTSGLGFFGRTYGTSKQTATKAQTGSSATAADCATCINGLIDALKNYNLIG